MAACEEERPEVLFICVPHGLVIATVGEPTHPDQEIACVRHPRMAREGPVVWQLSEPSVETDIVTALAVQDERHALLDGASIQHVSWGARASQRHFQPLEQFPIRDEELHKSTPVKDNS